MNIGIKRFSILCGFSAMLLGRLFAGDVMASSKNIAADKASLWSASLASGWDSLYMFRGVNQLPGFDGYGSSISWTALTLTWTPTANDTFALASWSAFGLGESDYKEIDGTFTYTRSIGDLSLSAGYALYTVLSAPDGLYSNELTASAAYEFHCGPVSVTPGIEYDYTLGPSPQHGGYVNANTGYLELRVDGEVPIYKDVVHAAPWIAAGFNFGYNSIQNAEEEVEPFSGANHMEMGLTVPIALSSAVTLSPYVAYSHEWVALPGTRLNTVWGGISLTFSF